MSALYLDTTPPPVEKLAAEARLSDTADLWPREILNELLKQHPYVGSYEANPIIEKTDAEQGYAIGHFQVHNRSATTPLGPGSKAMMAAQGVRTIRIPIIVKNKKLQPLDVFFDHKGSPFPLTDDRLRAALFRPQMFDGMKDGPGDVSMYNQLYPPNSRQDLAGGGGGQVVSLPQTKLSSAKPRFLLEHIASTITRDDLGRIKVAMERDPRLLRSLVHNEGTFPFLKFLGGLEPTSASDIAKVASASSRPPNVVQVERDGERYLVKMANSEEFAPDIVAADRNTAAEIAGEDLVAKADETGAATVSMDPTVHEDSLEDEEIAPITSFGEYRVKTSDGREHLGWVFPTVVDFDGGALPFCIFTNGTTSGVQERIVGSFVGRGVNIIRGKPEGYGFFYRVTSSGGVVAFHPVELKNRFQDENGPGFMGETMMGQPIVVKFNNDLQAPVEIEDGTYVLPGDVRWAPMGKNVETKLLSDASDFIKISMVKSAASMVRIVSDGRTWSFSGPPLEKVAHRWREQLHGGDAAFMACALGMEPGFAVDQLIKSARAGEARVPNCRPIRDGKHKLAEARAEARELWKRLPKRHLLLKEAATLEDTTTIDKVLSLGFLNPENIQIFISWLPDLEDALSKLAALLIAARLDHSDIPEDATKSAMTRMDEVIGGLKRLMFRQSEG